MQLPIVAPAPLVTAHAPAFRDLFENRCQFQHFQHYLTGLIVLPNKSLTNIARCLLESAYKTNLSRFLSEAPWCEADVNNRRIRYALYQTRTQRRQKAESLLVLDDTLCEHSAVCLTMLIATTIIPTAPTTLRVRRWDSRPIVRRPYQCLVVVGGTGGQFTNVYGINVRGVNPLLPA